MKDQSDALKLILIELRNARINGGFTEESLEDDLILGPGWIKSFENVDTSLSLEIFLSILSKLNVSLTDFTDCLSHINSNTQSIPRPIYAKQSGSRVDIHFKYSKY